MAENQKEIETEIDYDPHQIVEQVEDVHGNFYNVYSDVVQPKEEPIDSNIDSQSNEEQIDNNIDSQSNEEHIDNSDDSKSEDVNKHDAKRNRNENMEEQHHDEDVEVFELSGNEDKPPKRKRIQRQRTIMHVWTDEECFKLIDAVEKRRCLWDFSNANYKKTSRTENWAEVTDELGNNIQLDDAKSKWMNLRSSFKVNIEKLRKSKSGQGTADTIKISWRFFNALMFLERHDVAISTQSTSSMSLPVGVTDDSISSDLGVPGPSSTPVGQRNKRRRFTPTPCDADAPMNFKEIAVAALTNLNHLDKHAAFGEYIAAELRGLPDADSNALRQQLSNNLFQFLENIRIKNMPQPPSQAKQFVAEENLNNNVIVNVIPVTHLSQSPNVPSVLDIDAGSISSEAVLNDTISS